MIDALRITVPCEQLMRLLAELVAQKANRGDMITLRGDLGAGKTTFARYLIRSLLGSDEAEVPSPTFTLVQSYDTARFEVRHFDLYRISGPDELDELGFHETNDCLTLVEWPERAEGHLGTSRFDILIEDTMDDAATVRQVTITATEIAQFRLNRLAAADEFLRAHFSAADLGGIRIAYLQGDASTRGYARIKEGTGSRLLMDMPKMPDGPIIRDGKSYSEIAHLAEDARPFVAIARELRKAGLSAPRIDAFDAARGMALIEDLGDAVFASAMASGVPQAELWQAAADVLVHLRCHPAPVVAGTECDVAHPIPAYDADVMHAELDLLPEWYWPHANGRAIADDERARFHHVWAPFIAEVATSPANPATRAWVLRDFHSPNLIWLPDRTGIARIGVIDFQDAQIGHPAYDLVSLALDARLDVPRALHDALIDQYCTAAARMDAEFDGDAFRRAAAILGAQRNTKILGIFTRLSARDGKHGYLRHIPRIKQYLGWCLEHPELAPLRSWYDQSLQDARERPDLN
ncbi:MAG: tRNA (adenosine(37)-N6)-threonylcarbamoyltransferase complex ATPase subunit type 1 TsaE [Alphaproteobacteria bacterium]|nr:tRNA (adenosine(37)-N6)-threonylcarbamoyltransferase complex ATPase subunit type 1 TsaE [Alphaproteobacteria bacterium]